MLRRGGAGLALIGLAMVGLALVGLASPTAARAFEPTPAAVRYDGHRVIRVEPASTAQLRRLLALADDVWTERPGVGRSLDVRVSPATLAQLDAEGIAYRVRIDDVQRRVDDERERWRTPPDPHGAPTEWFSDFRDLPAIEAFIAALAQRRPDLVTVQTLGMSVEGRPILALRLDGPVTTETSTMLVTGTQHAREWLSPMAVVCVAEALVGGYGVDPEITDLLDALELVLVPVVNPDGYVHAWTTERYWRKNRHDGHGVDLNRNWAHAWGGLGSSNYPYDEDFRGEGPLSEPETAAVAAWMEAQPRLVASIDVHTYGELLLYPWSHQFSPPPDQAELAGLAEGMVEAIGAAHGHDYAAIQGSSLYPASGVADDWSYGQRGIMAFTLELRGDDFVVPPAEIEPACDETLAAVRQLGQWAREQSEPVPVPDDDQSATGGSTGGTGEHELTTGGGDGTTSATDPLPGGTAASTSPGEGEGEAEPATGCACAAEGGPIGAKSFLLLVPWAWIGRRSRRRGRGRAASLA